MSNIEEKIKEIDEWAGQPQPTEVSTNTPMEEEEDPSELRTTGQVKWFNDVDAYGFICPTDNSGDIFVHISDIEAKHATKPCLYTGEYVSFGIADNGINSDGTQRLKAVNVRGAFEPFSLMCDHGDIEFKSYSRHHFGGNTTSA